MTHALRQLLRDAQERLDYCNLNTQSREYADAAADANALMDIADALMQELEAMDRKRRS